MNKGKFQPCFHFSNGDDSREAFSGFLDLLSLIPDALLVICQDGKICTVNERTVQLFGYAKDEMIGNPVEMLIPARFRNQHVKHVQHYFEHPSLRPMENVLDLIGQHKDGHEIPVEICIGPLQGGKEAHAMAVIRDISKRKKSEASLLQLNNHLERQVAKRTLQLEQANKELHAFCYSVSHDLRAPLTGINGFGQVLQEDFSGQLGKQGNHYLNRLIESGQHMENLIDGMMELFEVVQDDLIMDPVDLGALSELVMNKIRTRAPDREVEWCREAAQGDEMMVSGDRRLLQQMLENLLENAWKYTKNKPLAKITFGVGQKGDARTFFIRDNGTGFPMAYADKLFTPFQRLHGREDFPGNGIGLATVQRIIHRHGGQIWGEGVVDRGATFYFQI